MQTGVTNEQFAENLRLLCDYQPSVAEVCRRLGINRAQFNKYLSGKHIPSRNVLRRLCDFFGVEEYEVFLPAEQFAQLVTLKPRVPEPEISGVASDNPQTRYLQTLSRLSAGQLGRYAGYYFEYSLSMAAPGRVLRALARIGQDDTGFFHGRYERLTAPGPSRKPVHSRYQGVPYFLQDRIFLVDGEVLTNNEISQTILYPTYQNRVTRLTGLKIGAAGHGSRTPTCCRVLWEHLGETVNINRAWRLCGLYDATDPAIDPAIRSSIENRIAPGEVGFTAPIGIVT